MRPCLTSFLLLSQSVFFIRLDSFLVKLLLYHQVTNAATVVNPKLITSVSVSLSIGSGLFPKIARGVIDNGQDQGLPS